MSVNSLIFYNVTCPNLFVTHLLFVCVSVKFSETPTVRYVLFTPVIDHRIGKENFIRIIGTYASADVKNKE